MCTFWGTTNVCVKGTLGTRQRSRGEVEQEKPNTTKEYCTMYISKMLVLYISNWNKTKEMLVLFIGNSMVDKSAKSYLVKISTATATASSRYLSHEQHCVLEHLALCIVSDSCVSSLQKRDFLRSSESCKLSCLVGNVHISCFAFLTKYCHARICYSCRSF